MNQLRWGLVVGLVAGLLIAFGSFTQFIVVAFFVLIGGVVGWFLQTRVDWERVFISRRR
ncbi:DUF2273 domain-containing protein [Glutamicibacter sp. JC586]|uniref:DUF2273 domain-containing protein n=1 Tax=Glutamicibacter sp. JC586 TaxID=2590552 RepID=UPI00135C205C|nr:DUF2273 domain-containing protein [Glutamicibacter sp. JC586]